MPKEVYVKDNDFVFVDKCNRFVYEKVIFVNYNGIFSMVRHDFYHSDKEIHNIVKELNLGKYIIIECKLYSAPKLWIINNDYYPYVKPEKKKRKYTKKKENEQTINAIK